VVAVLLLMAPLFISGVAGGVSRTFNEACTVWNARARYQNQTTPQWITDSLDCTIGGPGGMQVPSLASPQLQALSSPSLLSSAPL
jgi:hypothetical protein